MEESLYAIDLTLGDIYFIGRDSDYEKIQGTEKILITFDEDKIEFCREGDPLLDDYSGPIYNIHNLVSGDVESNLNYADVLIYFDNSASRLGF